MWLRLPYRLDMLRTVLLLSLTMSSYLFSPQGLAYSYDNYELIKRYVKCAALQNVVANILSNSEEEFYRHDLHRSAQDSTIVAKELVNTSRRYSQSMMNDLYATYLEEYRRIVQSDEQGEDLSFFLNSVRPQVEQCKRHNELQADIIQRKKQTVNTWSYE